MENVSYSPPITGGPIFGGPDGQKEALKLVFDPGAIIDGISALLKWDFKRALDKLTDGLGGAKSKGPKKLAKEAWDKLKGLLPNPKPPRKAPKPGNKLPPKLPPPTLPAGMKQAQFGEVMGWGTGNAAARGAINSLDRDALLRQGVTKEIAESWRDFYRGEAVRNPRNPSASGRADLMDAAARLLE